MAVVSPQGQVDVLKHLGITAAAVGAPIFSEMHMSQIGSVHGNCPVYVDQAAIDADHILLVNRIKDHTEYIGTTESGLLKLAVVGLGRQKGPDRGRRDRCGGRGRDRHLRRTARKGGGVPRAGRFCSMSGVTARPSRRRWCRAAPICRSPAAGSRPAI